jgi:hypothetical protein
MMAILNHKKHVFNHWMIAMQAGVQFKINSGL